jgi:hypothetical protein
MTAEKLRFFFTSFCPVSGSPLSGQPQGWHYEALRRIDGSTTDGWIYHCCWPCVCDSQDWLRVDTKTIQTLNGSEQFDFLVIGNPCTNPTAIPAQAPDVNCSSDGHLEQATLSDHNHIIVGMIHESGPSMSLGSNTSDASEVLGSGQMCEQRANSGNQSGMGTIFINVAKINPI